MLISSDTGAGQIVSRRDDTRFFDDVGCLAAEYRDGDAAYVHVGGEWIDVTAAFFAKAQSARTAMGSGIVAFTDASDARIADASGQAMTWTDVVRSIGGRR